MTKMLATVFAVAALTLTSACGGGGGDRPSADEIATSLQGSDSLLGGIPVDDEAATCLAEVLEASDLSDESLTALVEGDEDYEGDDGEVDVLQGLVTDIAECTGSSGDTTETPAP